MSKEKQIEIDVITYEQDRLNYFTDLMKATQNGYKRLFKKFKDAPYLSEEAQILSDAGRATHFVADVVEMLEKGYRKQSEWISVEERLPTVEEQARGLVGIVNGFNGKIRFKNARVFLNYDYNFNEWYSEDYDIQNCMIECWMPLPEPPKGGEADA